MKLIRQFDGYLARTVFASTLLAFGILFSVDSTIDLINDLESIGKRGFGVRHVLLMLLLGMPQRLYDLMPASLLLGALLGLGHLAARNELEALRSVGIGRIRILGSVLAVGTVLVAVSMVVGEAVAPTTEGYLRSLNKTSDLHKVSIRSRHGLWTREGHRFINIKQIFTDYRITDVWVYEMDEQHRLKRVSFAKSAVFEEDVWRLFQVRHSLITEHGIQTSSSDEEYWPRLITPELFDVVTVKPEHMSAAKLATYIDYLEDNGLNSQRYQLAYYNRFAVPLSGLAMLLLAAPFVFRPVRSGGQGQRMALGIGIAVAYNLLSRMLGNASVVYGVPAFLGAFFPVLLVLVITYVVYRRMLWV